MYQQKSGKYDKMPLQSHQNMYINEKIKQNNITNVSKDVECLRG